MNPELTSRSSSLAIDSRGYGRPRQRDDAGATKRMLAFNQDVQERETAFIGSSIVAAAPADVSARQLTICSGTYSNAQCCATDVLGLADLNCANPPTTPTSQEDFIDICATEGQQARCCALPILGQALLCGSPLG
ncbi:hypothetical protein D6C82_10311 [Aureobasidium pullulans]|nr:hypothetical protein D6C82_10311 [Aureobasidium pullulans]